MPTAARLKEHHIGLPLYTGFGELFKTPNAVSLNKYPARMPHKPELKNTLFFRIYNYIL